MEIERRNYLTAKRSALALKVYANRRRTDIIFGNQRKVEFYSDRMGENLAIILELSGSLSYLEREEIEEFISEAVATEFTTIKNVLDKTRAVLRGANTK
jgi:hypothetical protein